MKKVKNMKLKTEIKRGKNNRPRVLVKSRGNNKTIATTEPYNKISHAKKVAKALRRGSRG